MLRPDVAAGLQEQGGPRLCATGAGTKLSRKQRKRQAGLLSEDVGCNAKAKMRDETLGRRGAGLGHLERLAV